MFDWQKNWRGAGVVYAVGIIVASVIYGSQPKVGASTAKLVSFYDGDRTRILVATIIFCFSFLNLMWFGAAVASVLRDAGMGGWANAATASTAALGALLFLRMTVRAALAFSIAGAGHPEITSALNEFGWVLTVLLAFPAAMFVMSGSFGLWRARIISSGYFSAGVAAVILVLLGGTTLASDGFWAPDGAYALIGEIVLLVWIAVVSAFLAMRSEAPQPTAVPAH
jgi:hypothetical protein